MKVAIIGGSGYAAGELVRLLLQHPEVTECLVTSRSQAGQPIGEIHPALAPLTEARFSGASPGEAAGGRDAVFLALEHGESSRVAGALFETGPALVVDLAADFRIRDLGLYRKYYGEHSAPDLLPRFHYALADVTGTGLRGTRALATPGCFATAAQLALYPLARAGVELQASLFAVTGSSGAGAQLKSTTHHPARAHNLFAYSALNHRHEAEILQAWEQWSGRQGGVRLLVHAGPFVRGIYLTLHGFISNGWSLRHALTGRSITEWFREVYAGRPFVRILNSPPELTHAVGTNYALIHPSEGPDGHEVQVSVAIDNLVKGAAGQAVQAMNLALGMDECAGLTATGMFPC